MTRCMHCLNVGVVHSVVLSYFNQDTLLKESLDEASMSKPYPADNQLEYLEEGFQLVALMVRGNAGERANACRLIIDIYIYIHVCLYIDWIIHHRLYSAYQRRHEERGREAQSVGYRGSKRRPPRAAGKDQAERD
jgi:hypothetical protein